jgi:serine/threonine protein kinase
MNDQQSIPLTPGMIIGQRYEILRPLRSESHGEVFLARDQVVDMDVGLKYLANEHSEFERFLEYYRREALWGLKLHHPQILGVHHLDEGAAGVFLVQEPFHGTSLEELLGQTEPLTTQDALYFIEILAQGLAYAHKQGISHQNFTPQQVLVSATDGIKIINFAFPAEPQDLLAKPTLKAYIPPEVWEGSPLGPASNLFALGVIGYQMLTGHLPFALRSEGGLPYHLTNHPEHLQLLPEALRPIFHRCLKPDPHKRLKSAADFLSRLAIQRDKITPAVALASPLAEGEDRAETPSAKSAGSLKILPMEPEVEINPDWQEPPPRATSSWSAANNWVMGQTQRLATYLGPEPLRRNRRKQTAAVLAGGAGLLLIFLALASLFSPAKPPQAVVRTAPQVLSETSTAPVSPSEAQKPPVLAAAPTSAGAPGPGPAAPSVEAKASEAGVVPKPQTPLPEPATAIKPTVDASPAKPLKPQSKPVVKVEKPTPAATSAAAAKPLAPASSPKLLATYEKESAARQRADALIKQGKRAVVQKAKQGKKTVYQVWLQPTAPASTNKAKPTAKAVPAR